jgi:hypothetical protein
MLLRSEIIGKGSIEVGKLADLVVLNEDLFEIESQKIKDIQIFMTIVNGKIVFQQE